MPTTQIWNCPKLPFCGDQHHNYNFLTHKQDFPRMISNWNIYLYLTGVLEMKICPNQYQILSCLGEEGDNISLSVKSNSGLHFSPKETLQFLK